jgi:hypothetical protein
MKPVDKENRERWCCVYIGPPFFSETFTGWYIHMSLATLNLLQDDVICEGSENVLSK